MRNSSLQPYVGAVPNRIGRAVGRLGNGRHLVIVRHLARDEYVVSGHERRDKARVLRHRHTNRLRGLRLAVAAGQYREHRHVHVDAFDKQFVHQHRCAGRHEVLQHGFSGSLIGVHNLGIGIVLIDPHNVPQVATLGGDQPCETLENEIPLAPVTGPAAERQSGLDRNLRRQTMIEVRRVMPGEEQP